MRAWTLRHPNVMVVVWALLTLWFSFTFVVRINDRQWGWAIVAAVASLVTYDRLSTWWRRT